MRQFLLGGTGGRRSRKAGLQHLTGFQELGEGRIVEGKDEVEMLDQHLGPEGSDVGARALTDFHDIQHGQRPQRLAERWPADLHRGREIPLGGSLSPGRNWRSPISETRREAMRSGSAPGRIRRKVGAEETDRP